MMQVDIEITPNPGLSRVVGAHELAWCYIFDAIFADAYATGIRELDFVLPTAALVREVELRAEMTPALPAATGTARAVLTNVRAERGPDRVYTLHLGLTAGRIPWHSAVRPTGYVRQSGLSVFTWRARFLGIAIRLAHALDRPALADRTMYTVRKFFIGRRTAPAYYHLSVWGPGHPGSRS